MAMQLINDGQTIAGDVPGTAVSIGVYDGVHLGHRTLLQSLRQRAEADGLATAVVTFDKHPALAERYRVSSIPSVFIFRGGEVVERFVGLTDRQELSRALDAAA